MYNRDVASYLPQYYKEVKETDAIVRSEQTILDTVAEQIDLAFMRTFVTKTDEAGIDVFEHMLKIVANPAHESLEFRRMRIINRLSMKLPFSMIFLRNLLDEYLGRGNYELIMDYDHYTLYLNAHVGQYGALDELMYLLVTIIPVNIIYLVNNEILCYNDTKMYHPGFVNIGIEYVLIRDLQTEYTISVDTANVGAMGYAREYALSDTLRAVYAPSTSTQKPGAINGAIQYIIGGP